LLRHCVWFSAFAVGDRSYGTSFGFLCSRSETAPTASIAFVGALSERDFINSIHSKILIIHPHRIPPGILANPADKSRSHRIQNDVARNAPQVFMCPDHVIVKTGLPNATSNPSSDQSPAVLLHGFDEL